MAKIFGGPREYRVVTRRELGEVEWNAFWAISAGRQFWQQWDVCEALDCWDDRFDASLAVLDKSGSVLGILPGTVQEDRARGISRVRTFSSLGGLAYSPNLGDVNPLFQAVIRATFRMYGNDVLSLDPRPFGLGLSLVANQIAPPVSRMIITERRQWVSSLAQPLESLWEGLAGRSRTAVRKAERSGVVVRLAGNEDLDAVVQVHRESLIRNRQVPRTTDYWKVVWERLIGTNQAVCFVAEKDQQIVAVQLFATWAEGAYYWMGASTPEGNGLGANNITHWDAMKFLRKTGSTTLVHGDSITHQGGKAQSLSRFRESFGGDSRRYAVSHRFRSSAKGQLAKLGSHVRSR